MLTGFPWNLIVYSLSNQIEILQVTSLIGTYALNILCISLFISPSIFILRESKNEILVCIFFLLLPFILYVAGSSKIKSFQNLDLVKNDLDIIFANEDEISSLINAKSFDEVISFGKEINKQLVITRGERGAISICSEKISEIGVNKDLKIVDLTGAGDLFAAGYLHGIINTLSIKECLIKGTELSAKIIPKIGARI